MIDWDLEELTLTELLEIEMVNECYFRGVHCHVDILSNYQGFLA